LGSACGIDDLKAISKANEMCNAYSMDTISAGLSIAFAMECFENGVLTSDDTKGIQLEFGNHESMLKLIELMAYREGIGELLAEGSAAAAEKLGKAADAFSMQVKKMELPMHDPRLSNSLGLGYMVNPHGPDHMNSLIDFLSSSFGQGPDVTVPDALPLGLESAPLADIGPKKIALFKAVQAKRIICDSLVICAFLPYSYTHLADLTAAVTGWTTSIMEQMRVAERILTMGRWYNVREGFSAEDDKLPPRFFEPTRDGVLAGQSLSVEEMEKAKRYYYTLMGWDPDGIPLPEKMEELGIDHLVSGT
jgi:aldehyde:ferredoxin oxidoreductase